MRKLIFAIALLGCISILTGVSLAYESTSSLPVSQIMAEPAGEHGASYYFSTTGGEWGAPSCPSARYVWISWDVQSKKDILAIVLTAKTTGSNVRFYGECMGGGLYFWSNYVISQ